MRGFGCGCRLIHMCDGYLNILVRSVGLCLHAVELRIMKHFPPVVIRNSWGASRCGRLVRWLREGWWRRNDRLVVVGPYDATRKNKRKGSDVQGRSCATMMKIRESRLKHGCPPNSSGRWRLRELRP